MPSYSVDLLWRYNIPEYIQDIQGEKKQNSIFSTFEQCLLSLLCGYKNLLSGFITFSHTKIMTLRYYDADAKFAIFALEYKPFMMKKISIGYNKALEFL